MTLAKILVQLDPDLQPSVFDSVVAIDAGVDHLLRHANVSPAKVRDLVYGTIFTRHPQDLRHTAIFVGGTDVAAGEALLAAVTDTFFGPMRVSVLFDANGANTTAAAAVVLAGRHVRLSESTATVLAGTGPVGQRVARLLAGEGATVRVASRKLARAQAVCDELTRSLVHVADITDRLVSVATADEQQIGAAVTGAEVVIGAGAPGVQLLSEVTRTDTSTLRVAIDLNAVPPLGLEGIGVQDKAVDRGGVACYGAIGVGGTKMKIHRAALQQLFTSNDQLLDAEQVYQIGRRLEQKA